MYEILLVITLIAACAAAGMAGMMLARERASAREAREEFARTLGAFSQTLSAQMGSMAVVQESRFDSVRKTVEIK